MYNPKEVGKKKIRVRHSQFNLMALGAMEDSFEPLKVKFLVIGSWTSSNPNYLPEAPCPDNITLGIRASAYEF